MLELPLKCDEESISLCFVSIFGRTIGEMWVHHTNSNIQFQNDVTLRHCVDQIMSYDIILCKFASCIMSGLKVIEGALRCAPFSGPNSVKD